MGSFFDLDQSASSASPNLRACEPWAAAEIVDYHVKIQRARAFCNNFIRNFNDGVQSHTPMATPGMVVLRVHVIVMAAAAAAALLKTTPT